MDGNAATTYSYKSLGTCGEYVNSRRSGSKGFQKDWMREYMTAVNRLIPGKVDFFDGIKEEGILL